MKILCVGDSLGLPRDGVSYEDTWYYKIKKEFPEHDFIYKFKRSLTSKDLVGRSGKDFLGDYSLYYSPDIVITQFGIVDCSPRYINETKPIWMGLKIIFRKIGLEKLFWKTIKTIFTRSATCVYVSLGEFRDNVKEYCSILLDQAKVEQIIFIKIGIPGTKTQLASPNLIGNIDAYNRVYDEMSSLYPQRVFVINPLGVSDDKYYVDGYHTNGLGYNLVFESLAKVLRQSFQR